MRGAVRLGLIALLLAVGALLLRSRLDAQNAPNDRPANAAAASADAAAAFAKTNAVAGNQAATQALLDAPSWSGTELDGAIHFDAKGRLIADLSLRELFDYLLTGYGELSLAQIHSRLAEVAAAQHLDAQQTAQLSAMFSSYLAYRDALASAQVGGSDTTSLRETYDRRYVLRRQMLGPLAADGFFAASEAEDRYELDKVAITRDPKLDSASRNRQLAALRDTEAPPAVRAAEQRSAQITDLSATTAQMRAAGADDAQIAALREQTVGAAAAARLQQLDQARAQWQQRLDQIGQQRAQIMASAGVSDSDKQQQVDELIARNFTPTEALRARAQLQIP